jgi:hypothetical protein
VNCDDGVLNRFVLNNEEITKQLLSSFCLFFDQTDKCPLPETYEYIFDVLDSIFRYSKNQAIDYTLEFEKLGGLDYFERMQYLTDKKIVGKI